MTGRRRSQNPIIGVLQFIVSAAIMIAALLAVVGGGWYAATDSFPRFVSGLLVGCVIVIVAGAQAIRKLRPILR